MREGLRFVGMPWNRRRVVLAGLLALGLGSGGCTLCKPVVGAITGPVIMLANSGGDFGGCDPRATGCAFAVLAAVGCVGGLVTGIISDIQVLRGVAEDPTRNWADPFAINTGAPGL